MDEPGNSARSPHLAATEAAGMLGISLPTLYAYVSRGLIRSEPAGGGGRGRRYLREDVERLLQRREYRRDPTKATAEAMHWGTPILETQLTAIGHDGPLYRGRSAVDLACTADLEDVAALLWTGDAVGSARVLRDTASPLLRLDGNRDSGLPMMPRVQIVLTREAALDLRAYDDDPSGHVAIRTGSRILHLIAATLTRSSPWESDSIADGLTHAWCPSDPAAPRLLNAALILCADHELSASSFTARVVASAEANLYLVVVAAFSALQGFKHGGATELVEAFLREVRDANSAPDVIAARLRRGEQIPGFGHPLYPQGDPRATALLAMLEEAHAGSTVLRNARVVIEAVEGLTGKRPNIDFALVTLARTLQLPSGSALGLFALGRAVGLIGHALEQYGSGHLIRPRARYVGPAQ